MSISIKRLTKGWLVTGYGDDGIDAVYAEDSALSAFHRAASMLGIDPTSLHMSSAPPLSPAVEAMIERAEDAEGSTDDLKAGEAYREHGA